MLGLIFLNFLSHLFPSTSKYLPHMMCLNMFAALGFFFPLAPFFPLKIKPLKVLAMCPCCVHED